MKKILCALLAVLMILAATAIAEEKMVLWEHTAIIDEAGAEETVKVTLTVENPVNIEIIDEATVVDVYAAEITRNGVAPVFVVISPAEIAAHANLNMATEEQLMEYINVIGEQYDSYVYEKQTTESGNVYLAISDAAGTLREIWTIYEDTLIDIIQCNDDYSELKSEDQAFAIEILQGIWME